MFRMFFSFDSGTTVSRALGRAYRKYPPLLVERGKTHNLINHVYGTPTLLTEIFMDSVFNDSFFVDDMHVVDLWTRPHGNHGSAEHQCLLYVQSAL